MDPLFWILFAGNTLWAVWGILIGNGFAVLLNGFVSLFMLWIWAKSK